MSHAFSHEAEGCARDHAAASTSSRNRADRSRARLDTSVVIALPDVRAIELPEEAAISAITFAELAAGLETAFDPVTFDGAAARAYGRVYAAVAAAGRKARGRRAVDLLIAGTAIASGLPLFTCNPTEFEELAGLVEVVPVRPGPG